MAPLEQYLIPNRADEIAQALHAAPASIANDADVMVLGRGGYETVVKGRNSFVCLVQRSWFSGLTDNEFWNPRERAPICLRIPSIVDSDSGPSWTAPGIRRRTPPILLRCPR